MPGGIHAEVRRKSGDLQNWFYNILCVETEHKMFPSAEQAAAACEVNLIRIAEASIRQIKAATKK